MDLWAWNDGFNLIKFIDSMNQMKIIIATNNLSVNIVMKISHLWKFKPIYVHFEIDQFNILHYKVDAKK